MEKTVEQIEAQMAVLKAELAVAKARKELELAEATLDVVQAFTADAVTITNVHVYWSESGEFSSSSNYTLDDFERRATRAYFDSKIGYFKTKVLVRLSNGEEIGLRVDIGADGEKGLVHRLQLTQDRIKDNGGPADGYEEQVAKIRFDV